MEFDIKGFIESSYKAWDDRLSSVILLPDCNWRCPYCYTPELVLMPQRMLAIPWSRIRGYLDRSSGWIDGIVISGGEPTTQQWLPELCVRIKELGYPIKLNTNGSNPKMIYELISKGLINYISLDIKSPFEVAALANVCGIANQKDIMNLRESITTILRSGIQHEFRTTVVRGLHTPQDIERIALQIGNVQKYVIQNFQPKNTINPKFESIQPFTERELNNFRRSAKKFVKNIEIRQ